MRTLNIPMLQALIGLIAGIWLAQKGVLQVTTAMLIGLGAIAVLLVSLVFRYKASWLKSIAPYGFVLVSLATGAVSYQYSLPENNPKHYIHHHDKAPLLLRVQERLKPTLYQHKYLADVIQAGDASASGSVLLSIDKDSLAVLPSTGDRAWTTIQPEPINTPRNPDGFDYAAYMRGQGVLAQIQLDHDQLDYLAQPADGLEMSILRFRESVTTRIDALNMHPDNIAIFKGLFTGQKQDIDRGLYQQFARAGVVHVLAISGLHVGVLLLLLRLVFRPLRYLPRGELTSSICIIAILWMYAVFTGLSPSVSRAVLMFSLVQVGLSMRRGAATYNMLIVSAVILLLWNPMNLFQVGFQLSYSALLGIILFATPMRDLVPVLSHARWPSIWYLPSKVWQVATVTTAAQIGVLPFSLYYFNQFPLLFILANVPVLLVLFPFMAFGLVTLVLMMTIGVPDWMLRVIDSLLTMLRELVGWVSSHESWTITNVGFDAWQVVLAFISIYALGYAMLYRMDGRAAAIGVIAFAGLVWFQPLQAVEQDQFLVLHKSRHSAALQVSHGAIQLLVKDSSSVRVYDRIVQDIQNARQVRQLATGTLPTAFAIQERQVLMIDSLGAYDSSIKNSIVWLRNSPRVHLDILLDSLQPTHVIADGSNYTSDLKRWKGTCQQRQVPFHSTRDGAIDLLALD